MSEEVELPQNHPDPASNRSKEYEHLQTYEMVKVGQLLRDADEKVSILTAKIATLTEQVWNLQRAIGPPVLCDGGHFVSESDLGRCPTCIERDRRIASEAKLAALQEGAKVTYRVETLDGRPCYSGREFPNKYAADLYIRERLHVDQVRIVEVITRERTLNTTGDPK